MTEAMPFLRKLITFLWPPDIKPGAFSYLRVGTISSQYPSGSWIK